MPYETLNKRFRAAQKNIDRETSHVTMVVAELEKTLSSCPAVDSVVSLLDGVVEKLSVLKRKVCPLGMAGRSRHRQTVERMFRSHAARQRTESVLSPTYEEARACGH